MPCGCFLLDKDCSLLRNAAVPVLLPRQLLGNLCKLLLGMTSFGIRILVFRLRATEGWMGLALLHCE